MLNNNVELDARGEFICALARHLHEAGTPAGRLESALRNASTRLGLDVAVWSSPTAVILGIGDAGNARVQHTRVLRLQPGDVDLRTMVAVDDIAERVVKGELNAESGTRALVLAGAPVHPRRLWLETTFGFVMANIGVACLLGLAWVEIFVCAALGLVLAQLHLSIGTRKRFVQGIDAICAVLVGLTLSLVAALWTPINYSTTLLASLIVLVPGLTITVAATEIATQHLVSGTARMAGAFATLLKLTFGALVGAELVRILGLHALSGSSVGTPAWVQWMGLLISGVSFALLFKAPLKDFPLAIGAAVLGYACTRFGGQFYGKEFGVFFAGLVVTLCANFYARYAHRPGALIRLPGIILLVPGSVGFSSLARVFEKDVFLGLDAAVSLLLLVVSLVAGILFAGTLVSPRNSL